jgi:UDP-N-acetylglucosamine--dolichyl-phosphate N-acetylglucosaminephosphotransferase
MFFFIPFLLYKYLIVSTTGGGNRDSGFEQLGAVPNSELFPHDKLAGYLSAILCLESTVLLGLADDLFDIRWRNKFFLPAVAAIPLLIVYYVDFGITHVLIPGWFQRYFKTSTIELGSFYYIYMASVAIFCPNSINILAGINGLEVGQSVILAVIILLNDLCYLTSGSSPAIESHLFSACLLIPFLGVSITLLKYNWWPSRVFVGDTYCYFAGMVFAVVGILGHFSKTLLLFFIPQICNFIYSVPQLSGLVPCPRHRLPKFNEEDGLMYPSKAILEKKLNPVVSNVVILLSKLRLLDVNVNEKGDVKEVSNFTLINLFLVWFGPMREDKLCIVILSAQFTLGLLAILGRHTVGPRLFGYDNLWVVQ